MKTTNETVKIVSEDESDNESDDEYAEENIDTLEEQNNTSNDKYLEDGPNTNEEHNNKIPDVLRQYEPIEIIDVNGNGSCGYYSIQEGLKKHMITFHEDMNNFRKNIYDYVFETEMIDIFPQNEIFTKENIMQRIWHKDINFNVRCNEEYYFETCVQLPILSKKFEVNIICYAINGNNTIASIQKDNKQEFIWKHGHVDPKPICESSTYKRTIAILHVNAIHYMYLDFTI